MDSRDARYWLRIESGERLGERLPLSDGTVTLGRRPGNAIVLDDASVSGKHAELRIANGKALLVDLGSTNGTRVGGRQVEEEALAHGDAFSLGNIKLVFEDAQLADERPRATAAADSGEVGRISAEALAGIGKRSTVLLAFLLAVLGGGGYLAWHTLRGGEGQAVAANVVAVPGNKLADGSFENADKPLAWESADAAAQVFERDTGYARSGAFGMGCFLAAGEWAFARSPAFVIASRRGYEVHASLWAEDGAEARLGLELTDGQGRSFLAWSPALTKTDGFQELVLTCNGLPGLESGALVVAARATAEGTVSVDDVSVVQGEAHAPAATFQEFEAHRFGAASSTLAIVRSGSVIFPGIDIGSWTEDGLVGWAGADWTVATTEKGFTFRVAKVPQDADLCFAARPGDDSNEAGFVSTIGPDGYVSHANEFEARAVESLLLGQGVNLVRVGFAQPIAASGVTSDGTLSVRAELAGLSGFDMQVVFNEERVQANALADRARDAERQRRFGEALSAWNELLDRVPFEARSVQQAEAGRSRLIQAGLARVEEVRQEVERARFFQLSDLYRECIEAIEECAQTYADSEVEAEALELREAIRSEWSGEERAGKSSHERELRAVLDALDETKQPRIRSRVQAALEAQSEQE